MERYVKQLDRLSDIFKAFAVLAAFISVFRLVVSLVPSLGLAAALSGAGGLVGGIMGGGIVAINAAAGETFSAVLLVLFLHTMSVVLEFLAQLGEDIHLLRRSDWERRQVASGKTQRMD